MPSPDQDRAVSVDRDTKDVDRSSPSPGVTAVTSELGSMGAGEQSRSMVQMLRRGLAPGVGTSGSSDGDGGAPVQMLVQMEGEEGGTPPPKTALEELDEAISGNNATGIVNAWKKLSQEEKTTLGTNVPKSKQIVSILAGDNAKNASIAAFNLGGKDVTRYMDLTDAVWSDGLATETLDRFSRSSSQDTLVRNHLAKFSGLLATQKAQDVFSSLRNAAFLQACIDVPAFLAAADKELAMWTANSEANAAAAVAIWDARDAGLPAKLLANTAGTANVVALIKTVDVNKAWDVVDAAARSGGGTATKIMEMCASAWDADFAQRVLDMLTAGGQNFLVQNHIASFLCLQPAEAHVAFAKLYGVKADFLARYKDTPDFQSWVKATIALDVAIELNDNAGMNTAWTKLSVDDLRVVFKSTEKVRAALVGVKTVQGDPKVDEWAHWLSSNYGTFPADYFNILTSVWAGPYELLALARFTTVEQQDALVRGYLDRFPLIVANNSIDVALPLLYNDADRFVSAYAGVPAFQQWVDDNDQAPELPKAPNTGWRSKVLKGMKGIGMQAKLVKFIRKRAAEAEWREAVVVNAGLYPWVLQSLGTPVGSDTDADLIKTLYADGTGVKTADRFATYRSLYTATLFQSGTIHHTPWNIVAVTGGTDEFETQMKAVTPDDTALNAMLIQFGLLPRAQVNLAARVVMAAQRAQHAITRRGASATDFFQDLGGNWVKTAEPIWTTLDTSYYYPDGTFLLWTGAATAGAGAMAPVTNRMGHAGTDGSGSAYTFFQNHCVHEIGHAVGCKTLTGTGVPDDVIKTGADWVDSDAATFAEQYGLNSGLKGATYSMQKDALSAAVNVTGNEIADFLQKYLFGEATSGCSYVTKIGVDGAQAFTLIQTSPSTSAIAATPYVSTVIPTLKPKDKSSWYVLPAAPTAVGGKVTLYSTRVGNKWMKFKENYWTNRVSDYGVSSYKEMFAELYTAHYSSQKFTGMAEATTLFNALDVADSADFA